MAIKKVVNTASHQLLNPHDCLKELVSAYTDYLKIAEQEQTKRREIDAWEKTTVAKINTLREFLIGYLDKSFDERAENFRSLFAVVDNAISSGNNEQLALTLNSITEIAKSSPFKELANLANVQAALEDPDHEWTF
jgi:ribonucleotide reductase alpha subunit